MLTYLGICRKTSVSVLIVVRNLFRCIVEVNMECVIYLALDTSYNERKKNQVCLNKALRVLININNI
jgi:hypothetical protein